MSTQTKFVKGGATSVSVDLCLVQNAAATSPGDPITALAWNTASLTAYYRVGATGTLTAITLATQTVGGAYSSGGFVKIDDTHAPGGYRFDIPNAAIPATGESNIWFTGASNLATHCLKIMCPSSDALIESYVANGSAPSQDQALLQIISKLFEETISAGTGTCKKLDHSTTALTVTYNDAANPTAVTRAT